MKVKKTEEKRREEGRTNVRDLYGICGIDGGFEDWEMDQRCERVESQKRVWGNMDSKQARNKTVRTPSKHPESGRLLDGTPDAHCKPI
jgi:hypothetical protein